MLTDNFVSLYKGVLYDGIENVPLKSQDGSNGTIRSDDCKRKLALANSISLYIPGEENTCTLVVGTGITKDKSTDYTMEYVIQETSILQVVSQTSSIYYTQLADSLGTVSRTVKNISDTPITITEIGLYVRGNFDYNLWLLYREVLDTFVTLQPGKKYTFTIDLCVA